MEQFTSAFKGTGPNPREIRHESNELIKYAIQNVSLLSLTINLCGGGFLNAHDWSKWKNALMLAWQAPAFLYLFSMAKMERALSQVSMNKANKRSLHTNQSLDNLQALQLQKKQLFSEFPPNSIIDVLWEAKARRLGLSVLGEH